MKLTITGDAYALTSEIKVADIETLKKYNPEALSLKDTETNQTKFAISYSEGKPSVASFGITFGGKSRDENGYATITGSIPANCNSADTAKNFVVDIFSGVITHLETLEINIEKAVKAVAAERAELIKNITLS